MQVAIQFTLKAFFDQGGKGCYCRSLANTIIIIPVGGCAGLDSRPSHNTPICGIIQTATGKPNAIKYSLNCHIGELHGHGLADVGLWVVISGQCKYCDECAWRGCLCVCNIGTPLYEPDTAMVFRNTFMPLPQDQMSLTYLGHLLYTICALGTPHRQCSQVCCT